MLGIILILMGMIGFLTIADDLRHKGELLGVGSVSIGGLVLLAVSFRPKLKDNGQGLPKA